MSLVSYNSSLFSFSPTIEVDEDLITIKSSKALQLLTLFLLIESVIIDRKNKKVIIFHRFCYFFTSKIIIAFAEIDYLDYSFSDFATGWGLSLDEGGITKTDTIEKYTLSVSTKQGEKYKLCSFSGEGAKMTGLLGVLTGDDLIDFSGTQGEESRQLAFAFCKIFDVPLGKQFEFSNSTVCPNCSRKISNQIKRCYYCREVIEKIDE
ncbi:hypothetical protein [Zooshikella harenae]|uniref:Zinc ribbon domain-containing protein n=1 Tax=Zooshikella harenae TaxID=2827238 RepID=A0ABS5Z696_9GAMM|nr:hypothetical protein [Zooshikella harenae]MBU2709566.1 hypothetical protein [Zooshikella harenae]